MPSMICMQCTVGNDVVEFPMISDYLEHTKGGHVSRPKKILPPSKPVTPSATELKAMQEGSQKVIESAKRPLKEEKRLLVPIYLEYHFTGQCPQCFTDVRTIKIEVGKKWIMNAICVNCNRTLYQASVAPIPGEK